MTDMTAKTRHLTLPAPEPAPPPGPPARPSPSARLAEYREHLRLRHQRYVQVWRLIYEAKGIPWPFEGLRDDQLEIVTETPPRTARAVAAALRGEPAPETAGDDPQEGAAMSVRVPGPRPLTVGGLLRRWKRKPADRPGRKRRMAVALPGGGPELEPEPDQILTDNEWRTP